MLARILVVDDNEVNVELLVAMLASEHYVVRTAFDGFEALAKIAAEKPDIVLLDVMMPELDGFEVCRCIKADPATAHIPVIMVTALSGVDDLVRYLQTPDHVLIENADAARGQGSHGQLAVARQTELAD